MIVNDLAKEMKRLMPAVFLFCSLVAFADDGYAPVDLIKAEGTKIYSDDAGEHEHLLVLFSATDGIWLSYYKVELIFKNTVEAIYYGYTKFEGNHLYIKGGLATLGTISNGELIKEENLILTVFDVDEKEGTITVRYGGIAGGYAAFPDRDGKLITFKRTNKFSGSNFQLWK
jgi:hypothetical protein